MAALIDRVSEAGIGGETRELVDRSPQIALFVTAEASRYIATRGRTWPEVRPAMDGVGGTGELPAEMAVGVTRLLTLSADATAGEQSCTSRRSGDEIVNREQGGRRGRTHAVRGAGSATTKS